MVHSLEELNSFIKENNLRKKFWSSTKIEYECSKCKKISTLSVMQFKRKFASSDVLCNSCRKATFDKTEYKYHHWTEEEKEKANIARQQTCLKKYGVAFTGQTDAVKNAVSSAAKNRTKEERDASSKKRKETNLKKYGAESPIQNEEIRKRIEETNLKKYGAVNPAASEEIKEKIKNVFKEKYGISPLSSVEVREKIASTMEERYGVKVASKNEKIKDKIKKSVVATFNENRDNILAQTISTNIERYNIYWPSQSKEVKDKVKATMNERYGVDYITQNKEVAKNIRDKLLQYGADIFLKNCEDNNLRPIDFHYEGHYDHGPIYYKCECLKCHSIIEIAPHNKNFKCSICYGKNSIASFEEKEVLKYLKSIYDGKIEENYRRLISPMEIDIYIPEKKLAIEFDGNFWHNEFSKSKNYHKTKTMLCAEKGIHLVHIFEYEWVKNRKKIESILKSFLTYEHKLFARKCEVKEISSNDAKKFSEQNHLQGHSNAHVYLGLFYENELVEIETFGFPRFSRKYEWEIVRECTKENTIIVGGKSKLFSYFVQHYDPKSIISYCDASKFSGISYEKCGMKLVNWSDPGYVWSYGNKILSRYQCQKHKLIKKYPELKDLSEVETMHSLGYARIFDCGQKVFQWKKGEL